MKYRIFTAFCLLPAVLLCGCLNQTPLPDTEIAEQTAIAYMQNKYQTEIDIKNTQIIRIGTEQYQDVHFAIASSDSDRSYDIYITFDAADHTTPVVVSEEYMSDALSPVLNDYLNQKTGAQVSEVVNCSQIASGAGGGFAGDFPLITKPEEAEELIQNYKLDFDYRVYTTMSPETFEHRIRDLLPLFSDDYAFFRIYQCDTEKFTELSKQFKADGTIDPLLLHGQYTETKITSF